MTVECDGCGAMIAAPGYCAACDETDREIVRRAIREDELEKAVRDLIAALVHGWTDENGMLYSGPIHWLPDCDKIRDKIGRVLAALPPEDAP